MIFGITGNIEKENLHSVIEDIGNFLLKKKIGFFIDSKLFRTNSKSKFKKFSASVNSILRKKDIILLSLGGDGTFLRSARLVGSRNIPILGVNLGNLGFLAEVRTNEITHFIDDILKGNYRVTERVILEAQINRKKIFGLNDIVIDKADSIRMINIDAFYNDEKIFKVIADGIIISTPTGSTGYSLSSGGPVISPQSSVFSVTPICPHSLNIRPIIIPDDGHITIRTLGSSIARVTADGQTYISGKSPLEVRLKKADYTVKLVKRTGKTYFDTLKKKLLWSEDKRR
ncbi:MAG: NAD(+)/NADH kinase [Ignavibacteria bacterium]|nr:NAD(+)/NADH kinase [Ignavibacteria bacterium]